MMHPLEHMPTKYKSHASTKPRVVQAQGFVTAVSVTETAVHITEAKK